MGKSQYAEIGDTLAGDLAGCRPGTRIASEHEIAARFAVSRAVAGAALRELPVMTNIWWSGPDVIQVNRRDEQRMPQVATREVRPALLAASGTANEILS